MMDRTPGPWKVYEERLPYQLNGREREHISRKIGTAEDHPQLHGPLGVVNLSHGIGPHTFIKISEPDARLIAAAPDLLTALQRFAETPCRFGTSCCPPLVEMCDFCNARAVIAIAE